MKICEEVRGRLQEYLEGELSGEERERAAEHLGSCLECRRELVALRELLEQAAAMRQDEMPVRDLWPGIERRVRQGRRVRWFPALATAAALAMAVGALLLYPRPDRQAPVAAVVSDPAGAPEVMSARADQARHESGVYQLHKDLLGEIERRREVLDADTLHAIEAGMQELDRAIGEIRIALEKDPANPQLSRLLAVRYRQEMDLLKRVSRA